MPLSFTRVCLVASTFRECKAHWKSLRSKRKIVSFHCASVSTTRQTGSATCVARSLFRRTTPTNITLSACDVIAHALIKPRIGGISWTLVVGFLPRRNFERRLYFSFVVHGLGLRLKHNVSGEHSTYYLILLLILSARACVCACVTIKSEFKQRVNCDVSLRRVVRSLTFNDRTRLTKETKRCCSELPSPSVSSLDIFEYGHGVRLYSHVSETSVHFELTIFVSNPILTALLLRPLQWKMRSVRTSVHALVIVHVKLAI